MRWNEPAAATGFPAGASYPPYAYRRPNIAIAASRLPEMWIVSPNALVYFLAALAMLAVDRRAGSLAIFIMTCAVLGFTIVALLWSNRRPR